MARLWTAGGETQDDVLEGGLTSAGGGTFSYSTFAARSGARGFRFQSTASNLAIEKRLAFTGVTGRNYYARMPLSTSLFPVDGTVLARYLTAAAGNLLSIRFDAATETVELWNDTGTPAQIGGNSAALSLGWNVVELRINVAAGGGATSTAEARLNGTVFATTTTADLGATAPGILAFGFLSAPGATRAIEYDDLALNDDQGAAQNTWPGDGKIVLLLPIADSVRDTLWTGGAGGTTNLWDAVDNTPPVGTASETNTTQIEHAGNASGTTDDYEATMTSYSTAGLVSGDTVKVVQLIVAHGEDIATGTKVLSSEVLSNPAIAANGTFNAGDNVGALDTYPTGWAIHRGTVAYDPSVTLGTSPVMRVRRPETANRVASVCFMGLLVEYAPSPPDATGTVSAGSLSVAGQSVAAQAGSLGSVNGGALAVSGQAVTGTPVALGAVATGGHAVSGQSISGVAGSSGVVAAGGHAVAGQAVAGQAGSLATLNTGAHAVSGQAVAATAGASGAVASGSHAVAGQSVTAEAGAIGAVATGDHAVSGQIVAATEGGTPDTGTVDAGALAVSGQAVAAQAGALGIVATGAHTVSGQSASGVAGTTGLVATGAHGVAGQAVAGVAGSLGTVNAGGLAVAGQTIFAESAESATGVVATGVHAVSGQSLAATAGSVGAVGTGPHAVSGQAVAAEEGGTPATGDVATGTLAVAGQSVAAQSGSVGSVVPGSHAVAGQSLAGAAGSVGTVSPQTLAVMGQIVGASVAELAAIIAGALVVSGQGVAASAGTVAVIGTGTLVVLGQLVDAPGQIFPVVRFVGPSRSVAFAGARSAAFVGVARDVDFTGGP